MGLAGIFRAFAAMLLAISASMSFPAITALASGEDEFLSYLFSIIVTLIAFFGAFLSGRGKTQPMNLRGVLIVVLIWWAVIPLFAGAPFLLQGASVADAYFEAVAAMSTTGGWLEKTAAYATNSGALWRAQLQWIGGFSSIVIAAAIFIRPAFIGIDTLLPPFSRGDTASFMAALRTAAAGFASTYVMITALSIIAIALAGAPFFDAVIMGLSGVASGGFTPRDDGVSSYSTLVLIAVGGVYLVGAANFILLARFFRGGAERVRDVETRAYLIIIIAVAILFWVSAGAGDVDLVVLQTFNAISLISTNGLTIGEAPPLVVATVTAIIGGAAISTAGGFKILRWLVIMRRAREEIRRLVLPNAVFGARRVANEFGVWMHFIVFTMTLGALVFFIAADGHAFNIAVAAATASLSNAGPLLYLADESVRGYAIFSEPMRWLIVVAMILGRLETAVALALLNRGFWRA